MPPNIRNCIKVNDRRPKYARFDSNFIARNWVKHYLYGAGTRRGGCGDRRLHRALTLHCVEAVDISGNRARERKCIEPVGRKYSAAFIATNANFAASATKMRHICCLLLLGQRSFRNTCSNRSIESDAEMYGSAGSATATPTPEKSDDSHDETEDCVPAAHAFRVRSTAFTFNNTNKYLLKYVIVARWWLRLCWGIRTFGFHLASIGRSAIEKTLRADELQKPSIDRALMCASGCVRLWFS